MLKVSDCNTSSFTTFSPETGKELETLDQKAFDKMLSKAFHSVRKSVEGQGMTAVPADVEIATSEAIAFLWERAQDVDEYRITFWLEHRKALPLQAFINKKARQIYYDMMKRPGESRRMLGTTELHGKAKVDKALSNVDFYESLQHLQPIEYQIMAKMIINGYSKKEVAERIECSPSNVSRMLKILGQFMTEWENW